MTSLQTTFAVGDLVYESFELRQVEQLLAPRPGKVHVPGQVEVVCYPNLPSAKYGGARMGCGSALRVVPVDDHTTAITNHFVSVDKQYLSKLPKRFFRAPGNDRADVYGWTVSQWHMVLRGAQSLASFDILVTDLMEDRAVINYRQQLELIR